MNDADAIDAHALERLRELGGEAFLKQMIGLFLELAQNKLRAARLAETAGDLSAVGKAVHPLRSSSGNVGAGAVQELAARIETLALEQKADLIPPLLRELEAAFDRVKPRLEREKDLPGP